MNDGVLRVVSMNEEGRGRVVMATGRARLLQYAGRSLVVAPARPNDSAVKVGRIARARAGPKKGTNS